MIQLKVYKIAGDNDSAIFLDLYDTEPIKLTLSIEDITNADASSVFSKTFRVPATRDNNEFFENAFEIDGIDFDVTLKNQAQILVDGAEFREGHVRLQKIFRNQDLDRIDYELLFLGETRDFSSVIGEKTLCQINMTDFSWEGLPQDYTNADDFVGPFTYTDVVTSWNAFPENSSLTAGTADGDILFPLINHGNTYTDGDPDQGAILLNRGPSHDDPGVRSFVHQNNALSPGRLKPMIRAKRIWDQIFEDVNYTYQSDFLNSERFHQMYVSAFGNNEQVGIEVGQTTGSIFASEEGSQGDNQFGAYMYNSTVTQNQSNSYSVGSQAIGSSFVCPPGGTSTPTGAYYLMDASASMRIEVEQSNGPNIQVSGRIELVVVNSAGGSIDRILAAGNYTSNGGTSTLNWDSRNGNDVVAGERLQVFFFANSGFVDYDIIQDTTWNCTAAPGDYYAPLDLDCEYKQIDYIKDVLTMFRLVMQPDNERPNNFIIEPWQDFIGSGTTYDWSHKLAEQNDQVLEPLFNTQSSTIEYSLAQDEDFINKFHFDNNKHPYGWLQFNSANELLKGNRKIDVKGIAPTPIDQIIQGNFPEYTFILPSIVEVTGEQTVTSGGIAPRPEQLAIKPKTRFLFYNGEQNITETENQWWLLDGSTEVLQTTWPLVSPYENWPIQPSSLNLNFSNDTRYYIQPSPGAGYFDQGSTLFDEYWSRYIASLYNKFSRRLTAKFILNNVDLQYLTFDDVIFVNGKYYRPEKIIDAQVGAETEVTVQLITLNDQRPIWLDEPLTGFSVAVSNTSCVGGQGEIQVTTNGTPAFTWELDASGAQGNANPTGTAPFIFTISAPVGIDTLIVTDSLGRTATIQVDVPASTAIPVSSTFNIVNPTICTESPLVEDTIVQYETTTPIAAPSGGNYPRFDTKIIDLLETQVARPLPATGTGFNALNSGIQYQLNCDTYPSLQTKWSATITWTNTGFPGLCTTCQWSQYEPGYFDHTAPGGVSVIPLQYISGWPQTMPAVGTSFTFTITDLPYTFPASGMASMAFPTLKNGTLNNDFWTAWENTGTLTGKQITQATTCNGEIDVTPNGGSGGPYTTIWSDAYAGEDRTGLCPGTYEYYVEDANGCQSDIFNVTLTCQTELITYQLREHLNNCTQSSSAIYIATSTSQLPINQTVTLNERAGCYYVQAVSTDTPLYTIDALSVDCASCVGGSTPLSWKAENCDVQGDFIYVSLTQTQLSPGDVVKASGTCYEVIEQSTIAASTTYQDVFTDCQTCNLSNGANYLVQDCNGFSGGVGSSTVTLNIGDVIKVGANCAEVLSVSQGTPTFVIDASTIYEDCNDCQGITPPVQSCHTIENTGLGTATGNYVYNSLGYGWSCPSGGTIALCAEVGSVTTTTGTVGISVSPGTCTSVKQCRIPPPLCQSYLISNDGGSNPGSYSYVNCDGFNIGGFLNLGSSVNVCAIQTPTVSSGLTISFGVQSCD